MEMVYETPRLLLKVLREDAADKVLEFYQENKEIFERYEMDRGENFYTKAHQAALLRCEYNLMVRMQMTRFWVFEKDQPESIVGTFSFHNIRYASYLDCELGYKFHQSVWGKGYAAESISRGIEAMFNEQGLHRIEALVMPENERSRRLLKALGFQLEGIKRQNVRLRGTWCDHEVYSLLKEEQNLYVRGRSQ